MSTKSKKQSQRPWDDVPVPDTMRARRSYPVIQWINRGGDLRPPQERGGFFAAQRFGDIALPAGQPARFHQDDGSFSHAFRAAILAVRQG